MAEYKIYFKRSAVKDLAAIFKKDLQRIINRIDLLRTSSALSIASIFLKKIRDHRVVKSFPARSVIGSGREIIASFIPFRTMCSPSGLSKSAAAAMSIDR
jgi:hypothetical protein